MPRRRFSVEAAGLTRGQHDWGQTGQLPGTLSPDFAAPVGSLLRSSGARDLREAGFGSAPTLRARGLKAGPQACLE